MLTFSFFRKQSLIMSLWQNIVSPRTTITETETDRQRPWPSVNYVIIMRCCSVHAGIQKASDGSVIPSKPWTGNTSRRKDRSPGQEELDRSEHTPAECPRVYRRQSTIVQTSVNRPAPCIRPKSALRWVWGTASSWAEKGRTRFGDRKRPADMFSYY